MASSGIKSAHILVFISVYVTHTISIPTDIDANSLIPFPDVPLEFTKVTAKYGYLTEEHSATTEDGYILRLFRMAHGKNCHEKKRLPPVLLMHGLLETSDAWIDAGPKAGLAYLIADACFDLWVGNVRGNAYSRRHVTLNPDKDSKFWHFSVDEMGRYDIPAMIDYVLNKTGEEKLNYIGYSQGCGTFFIMCSERPEYNDKVNVMIAIAPATRHINTKSLPFRISLIALADMAKTLSDSGVDEILPRDDATQQLWATFCEFPLVVDFCGFGLAGVGDFAHPGSISKKTVGMVYSHFPAGTSLQNLARYGQGLQNPEFVKYDYGREKNLKVYGTEKPPKHNLSAVTVPVVVIYGRNDGIVDVKDVKWLIGKLPHVVDVLEVEDPQWNHMDPNYSKYTKKLIFPKIFEHLSANSYK